MHNNAHGLGGQLRRCRILFANDDAIGSDVAAIGVHPHHIFRHVGQNVLFTQHLRHPPPAFQIHPQQTNFRRVCRRRLCEFRLQRGIIRVLGLQRRQCAVNIVRCQRFGERGVNRQGDRIIVDDQPLHTRCARGPAVTQVCCEPRENTRRDIVQRHTQHHHHQQSLHQTLVYVTT